MPAGLTGPGEELSLQPDLAQVPLFRRGEVDLYTPERRLCLSALISSKVLYAPLRSISASPKSLCCRQSHFSHWAPLGGERLPQSVQRGMLLEVTWMESVKRKKPKASRLVIIPGVGPHRSSGKQPLKGHAVRSCVQADTQQSRDTLSRGNIPTCSKGRPPAGTDNPRGLVSRTRARCPQR